MAQYIRFEIYLPVVYTVHEVDAHSGEERSITHALDDEILEAFINQVTGKYHGVTQANPLAPALYKGWWRPDKKAKFEVDYLTYLFGLVPIHRSDGAKKFFTEWKLRFESAENQEVILLLYYPVQTIGDFFADA